MSDPTQRAEGTERWATGLHGALALLCLALFASAPWLGMAGRLRPDAGWVDHAHVVLGLAMLPAAAVYAGLILRGGRWRGLLPWLGGDLKPVARDLAGLCRGQLPAAEGGGLFPLIEGLLLLALLVTTLTGALWWLTQGQPVALDWRERHIGCAWILGGLALLHAASVASHLLDFVRP